MRSAARALVALAPLLAACTAHVRPQIPASEGYVFPAPGPGELKVDEKRELESAWRTLLSGAAGDAEKQFGKLLERRPASPAAQTGLAYARLRSGRPAEALAGFERALATRAEYLPALSGAGAAALKKGDGEAALDYYRRAERLAPTDAVLLKHLSEVKVQLTEKHVAAAHAARDAGDADRAASEYEAALLAAPELSGVRLEWSELLLSLGREDAALNVLEADPTDDLQVLERLADLASSRRDYSRAVEAYRRALVRNPKDVDLRRRAGEAQKALELSRMPPEYQHIYTASQLVRADLAALLSVKITALGRLTPGEPEVAIDISGSWAREHILRVLAFDLMDVYPNHSFQPGATVRRGDLAHAVARVLDLVRWPSVTAVSPRDMSPNNLFYEATLRAVAAGLMDLTPSGTFEPWRPVSGPDAVAVLDALARLVGS